MNVHGPLCECPDGFELQLDNSTCTGKYKVFNSMKLSCCCYQLFNFFPSNFKVAPLNSMVPYLHGKKIPYSVRIARGSLP